MVNKPKIGADELGAVIDSFAMTQAVLFMALASREESDDALQLLDQLAAAAQRSGDALSPLRQAVVDATAKNVRQLQAIVQGNGPAEPALHARDAQGQP
jgi:alkanesulfonate monooxygenase SsuD/methylene tetrahydromethanopterin reductase-like flavin-dependent oxidoreductase (luciferase family)